jgi:hypothetical protein
MRALVALVEALLAALRLLARRRGLLEPEAQPERRADRDVERLAPFADLLRRSSSSVSLPRIAAASARSAASQRSCTVESGESSPANSVARHRDDAVLGLGLLVRAHDVIDELLDEALDHLDGGRLRRVAAVDHERARGGRHRARQLFEVAQVFRDPDRCPARRELPVRVVRRAG